MTGVTGQDELNGVNVPYMPHRVRSSIPGAYAFKELLLRIDKAQRTAVARTGELDIRTAAGALDAALRDVAIRRGMMLALAELICTNLGGSPIDVHKWTPLEHFEIPEDREAQQ